ncbi:unnamed protein product [Protopolystoma xenopodis]|uniref:Uncharacterized protein n=1 Tax=Protopolystoma xenopodis TaxID=117903 RepID=A0A448WEL0_9PLAT|nr:unnamed protein product [Protopolystoma xenopodis]
MFARRSFTLGGVGHARSSRQAITATHSGGGLLNIGKPILTQLQPHSAERDFSLDQFSPVAVTTSSHAPMAMEACDQTLTALVWPQQPDTRIASSSTPISSITSSICASASSSESSSQLPLRELNQSTAASPALSLSSTLCPDNSSDHQQRHQPSLNLSDNLGERVATIWTQGMPFCAPVERTVSVNQPNEDYDAMDEVGPAIILSLSPSNSLNTSSVGLTSLSQLVRSVRATLCNIHNPVFFAIEFVISRIGPLAGCRRNSDPEHWQQVRPEASVLTPPVVVPSGVCRDPVPSLFPGPLPPLLFPSDSLSNVVTSELPALQPIAADGFLIAAPDQLLPSSTGFGTGLGLCPIQTGSVCQAKSVSLPPLASPPKQTSESQHPTLYFSPLPLLLSPSNSITPCTTTKYTTSFTSQGDCCANRLPPSLSRSSPSDFCTSHQMASTLLTVAGFRSPGLAPQLA